MTPRSLTDELNSTLRRHSLDAPEPAATIEKILAATVHSAPLESSDSSSIAVTADPPTPIRRSSRRPGRVVLAVAASVAALVAGVAVVNQIRTGGTKGTASSGAMDRAAGSLAVPNASSTAGPERAGPTGTNGLAAGASGLDCGTGTTPRTSFSVDVASTGQQIVIGDCVNPAGVRSGSQLEVRGGADSPLILIYRSLAVDISAVTVSDTTITVQARQLVQRSGIAAGSLVQLELILPNAVATYSLPGPPPATLIAPPCANRADVTARISLPASSTGAVPIRLTNSGSQPCAVSGYPVLANADTRTPITGRYALAGSAGGHRGALVPILRVDPGQTVSALVEPNPDDNPSASCAQVGPLAVSAIMAANTSQPLKLICGVIIHPWVAGTTGSD